MTTVKVKLEKERIEELVTVEEFIGAVSGNQASVVKILSKFVLDDAGNYLPEVDGLNALKTVTIKKLKELSANLSKELRDALINPPSGGT